MENNLYLKPLKEIDQALWLSYWKEYYDYNLHPGTLKIYEQEKNKKPEEKLEELRKQEEGIEPYGLKSIQYVLMNNEKIIGNGSIFLNPEVVPPEETPNHIGGGISKQYRNKGYGTHMLHLFIKELNDLGYEEITLCCEDNNIPSAKMIENNFGILKDIVTYKGPIKERQGKPHRKYIINVPESLKAYLQNENPKKR